MTSRNCPKCKAEMHPFSLDPVTEVDFCESCKGMWLRQGQLARAVGTPEDISELRLALMSAVRTEFECPQCRSASHPQFLERFRYSMPAATEIDFCRRCSGVFLDFEEFGAIRRAAPLLRPAPKLPAASVPRPGSVDHDDNPLHVPFHHWKLHLWSLPIALALAYFSHAIALTRVFSHYWLEMPVHELGHAVAGWLGGRAMIPIPLMTFGLNSERSAFVFLLLASALIYLALRAMRERRMFPVVACMVALLAAVYCTWIGSDERSRMLLVYGGVAGTFLVSTFFIVSFYYRFPAKLRWDFFRFIPLSIGMNVFVLELTYWRAIAAGRAYLPKGSTIVGGDDPNGDINRLLGEFGWQEPELISHFVRMGMLCALVIAGHYFYFLWKARLSRPGR